MRLLFVHLGETRADHLWLNIERLQEEFNLPISVVLTSQKFITKANKMNVHVFEYSSSINDELFSKFEHDENFRGGFWRYSLERLLALSSFHAKFPNDGILHLESDILLLKGFPIEVISKLKKLFWVGFNDERDVGSILFSPNSHETAWLAKELKVLISEKPWITDMSALFDIRIRNRERIGLFPDSPNNVKSDFEGIFDGAPIGMWLTGRDPRNYKGFVLKFLDMSESPINPREMRLKVLTNGQLVTYSNMPIYNLHIHSKDLRYFQTGNMDLISKNIVSSHSGKKIRTFSIKIFLKLVINKIKKKFIT